MLLLLRRGVCKNKRHLALRWGAKMALICLAVQAIKEIPHLLQSSALDAPSPSCTSVSPCPGCTGSCHSWQPAFAGETSPQMAKNPPEPILHACLPLVDLDKVLPHVRWSCIGLMRTSTRERFASRQAESPLPPPPPASSSLRRSKQWHKG